MNFVFISPNFPKIYSHFVKELNKKGINVLGIGDEPFESLCQELKENLTEYCYVSDMNNLTWMINSIDYFQKKYGKIDFIESNNEYWMKNDAKLREWFNVENGYRPSDLDVYQSKSGMKQFFNKAGLKTARYIIASTIEESLKFVNEVGYPIFAKPDSGVGASATYKIKNIEELKLFHNEIHEETYIIEEFLDASIISFDGIANKDSEVVIAFKENFPTPIAKVVSENLNVYYFAEGKMTNEFRKMGEKIVKAFNIESRCFHIELFLLNTDKEGFGKKGEIVALEVNLRSPGGNTPDLLNLVSKVNYYEAYADMIANNVCHLDSETNFVAYSINRKKGSKFLHNDDEIIEKYPSNLKQTGTYPPLFRDAMGDRYFFFLFERDEKIENEFLDFVIS